HRGPETPALQHSAGRAPAVRVRPDDRGLMGSRTGLHLDYLSLAEFAAARWGGVLGVATFAGPRLARSDVPVAQINIPILDDDGGLCEVWRTGQDVESGRHGGVCYSRTTD